MTDRTHLQEAQKEAPIETSEQVLMEAIGEVMMHIDGMNLDEENEAVKEGARIQGRFPEPVSYDYLSKRAQKAVDDLVEYVKKSGKFPAGVMRVILRPAFAPSIIGWSGDVAVVNAMLDILAERLGLSEVDDMIEESRRGVRERVSDEGVPQLINFGKVKVWRYLRKARQMVRFAHEARKNDAQFRDIFGLHIDIGEKNTMPTPENWGCITVSASETEQESRHFLEASAPLGMTIVEYIDELEKYIKQIQDIEGQYYEVNLSAWVIRETEPDFPVTPMQYVAKCFEMIEMLKKNKNLQMKFARSSMTLTVNFMSHRSPSEGYQIESGHSGKENLVVSVGYDLSISEIITRIEECLKAKQQR